MVRAAGIFAPVVGHVGDGNFHMLMVIDTNNRYEVQGGGGGAGGAEGGTGKVGGVLAGGPVWRDRLS